MGVKLRCGGLSAGCLGPGLGPEDEIRLLRKQEPP